MTQAGEFPEFPTGNGGKFNPHSEGAHAMLCVDAIYLGERVERWDGKEKVSPKCAIVFASGERNGADELVTVSREFTYNVGDRAGLRAFLQQWRGAAERERPHLRAHRQRVAAGEGDAEAGGRGLRARAVLGRAHHGLRG
jgi:hypothetical protein